MLIFWNSHGATAVVSDVNHASDLIKKKRTANPQEIHDIQLVLTCSSAARERFSG